MLKGDLMGITPLREDLSQNMLTTYDSDLMEKIRTGDHI